MSCAAPHKVQINPFPLQKYYRQNECEGKYGFISVSCQMFFFNRQHIFMLQTADVVMYMQESIFSLTYILFYFTFILFFCHRRNPSCHFFVPRSVLSSHKNLKLHESVKPPSCTHAPIPGHCF